MPGSKHTQARIFHFDKVIFHIRPGNLAPVIPADLLQLNRLPRATELDIKIIDNPLTVTDLKSKVLSFLGALPQNLVNRDLISIREVEYAVVLCPRTP